MAEAFYLRSRAAKDGSAVSYAHPYDRASTRRFAKREKTLAAAGDIVWIVDEAGNLVLPADQVRLRLQYRNASQRRALDRERLPLSRAPGRAKIAASLDGGSRRRRAGPAITRSRIGRRADGERIEKRMANSVGQACNDVLLRQAGSVGRAPHECCVRAAARIAPGPRQARDWNPSPIA